MPSRHQSDGKKINESAKINMKTARATNIMPFWTAFQPWLPGDPKPVPP